MYMHTNGWAYVHHARMHARTHTYTYTRTCLYGMHVQASGTLLLWLKYVLLGKVF